MIYDMIWYMIYDILLVIKLYDSFYTFDMIMLILITDNDMKK